MRRRLFLPGVSRVSRVLNQTQGIARYVRGLGTIGSVCPSSPVLARAMAQAVRALGEAPEEIVFAGIGNGIVAQQFLAWSQRIVFIDIEEDFCRRFSFRLNSPDHRVVCADFADFLDQNPGQHGRAIVFCLPLRGPYFSEKVVESLLRDVHAGATAVLFTYLPHFPGSRLSRLMKTLGISLTRHAWIARNLPPAFVYLLKPPVR